MSQVYGELSSPILSTNSWPGHVGSARRSGGEVVQGLPGHGASFRTSAASLANSLWSEPQSCAHIESMHSVAGRARGVATGSRPGCAGLLLGARHAG